MKPAPVPPLPASSTKRPRRRNPGEEGEPLGAPGRYPLLTRVAVSHGVLLIGGVTQTNTVDRCERELGLLLEWVPVIGANSHAQRNVVGRVSRGTLGAIIILEGLVGHRLSGPLVRACKLVGTPFAYGGRAGSEQLRAAFRDLEQSLAARAREDEGAPP